MHETTGTHPDLKIAQKVLPSSLLNAIQHIFNQNIDHTALVGGTALSGFYAGHRRSDDIDLFTQSEISFTTVVLAVESLKKIGAKFSNETRSKQYYHSLCSFENHTFTIDVVLDENVFKVGSFKKIKKILVADLLTLFKMKAATLVSRCSEKDLYDLLWLFQNSVNEGLDVECLISSAQEIDLGASAESMLISLSGSLLSAEACDFTIHESSSSAYKKIVALRKQLISEIREFDLGKKNSPLKDIVRALEKLKG